MSHYYSTSKYLEYYAPVTTLLTDTLERIKELVENDPWKDIGQASPVTLKAISDAIEDAEGEIECIEDEYTRGGTRP